MPRILVHVQHLVGIGHLRRAASLARAAAAAGADVLCVTGGYPVPDLELGEAELLQLPPARAQDLRYKALVDEQGDVVDDDWRRTRRDWLLEVASGWQPDVIVTETFPFGRRLLRFELDPLLAWCAEQPRRPRLVTSIRDILEGFPGPAGRMERVIQTLKQSYDRVLVHADRKWVALADTFPGADEIDAMVEYTGYIHSSDSRAADAAALPESDQGLVLVSTGGGAVGAELAGIALMAARLGPEYWQWLVLAGHNMAATEFDHLASLAPANARVERNRPDFAALLAAATVSVSQAGYNTVCDLLSVPTPAVLVPFLADGQFEQTHRARLLAERGRVHVAALLDLEPMLLLDTIAHATRSIDAVGNTAYAPAALDGARVSAEHLLALAAC
jgi:predicted glycosyltransferase